MKDKLVRITGYKNTLLWYKESIGKVIKVIYNPLYTDVYIVSNSIVKELSPKIYNNNPDPDNDIWIIFRQDCIEWKQEQLSLFEDIND